MADKSPGGARPCDLPALARAALYLGATAFGGLGVTLKLIQRDFVERRGWLTARDLADAMAFTKPLPGSTVVQVVTFLGWRLGRWPGALVATLAFLAPAVILMAVAAAAAFSLPDAPWVAGALTGLHVAVVGLLAAAMWDLARSEAASPVLVAVLLAALAAGLFVNAALVVVTAGLAGIVAGRRTSRA